MGPRAPTLTRIPFQTEDIDKWRETVKEYREEPIGVARKFEWIVKNLDPDWKDVDLMLEAMTETEKGMVLKTARDHVRAQISAGALQGTEEQHVPLRDPGWDPNDQTQYRLVQQYCIWIQYGLEHGIPKAVNWSALYEAKQGQTEIPTEFLDRLRTAVRKYTTTDPASDAARQQPVSLFIGQPANDIRKKLQKLQELDVRTLEKLVEKAWRVYHNRDENDRKKMGQVLASATVAALSQQNEEVLRGQAQRNYDKRRLKINQCARCKGFRQWQRECPQNRKAPCPRIVADLQSTE